MNNATNDGPTDIHARVSALDTALRFSNGRAVNAEELVHDAKIFHVYLVNATEPAVSTLPPHQQRVIDEHADLSDKIVKLEAFVDTERYNSLPEAERVRLRAQLLPMEAYRSILADRIEAF